MVAVWFDRLTMIGKKPFVLSPEPVGGPKDERQLRRGFDEVLRLKKFT